jgi:transposase
MLNLQGHKSNDMISLPLDIPDIAVVKVNQNSQGDYIITVKSTLDGTRCQYCGRQLTRLHGHGRWIKLRHLPILGRRVYLRLRPKQYVCPDCSDKITTQQLDWYTHRSPHTQAYDEYLLRLLVNSTVEDVSCKEQVGYDAVQGALTRHVDPGVNWTEFDALPVIGIDEIALTKGRGNYVAIITAQSAAGHVAVLAVLPDRKKATVRQFLETIPARLWPTLETVCTDMWEGYANAAQEFAAAHPEVALYVVTDRYHVAKNYRQSVDTVRKQECRRLKRELSKAEYAQLKGALWVVRKNHADLTPDDQVLLRRLFSYSPRLKAAYTLREELTAILNQPLTFEQGLHRLRAWSAKVRRQGLACFDSFLTTLDNWHVQIANYFRDRRSSGFVEGLNNRLKTLKRRCYGILRVETLFQRLYLDLEGYRRFAPATH